MLRTLKDWFAGKFGDNRPLRPATAHLELEALEDRLVPSTTQVFVLDNSHTLYSENPGSPQTKTFVASGVQAFAPTDASDVYVVTGASQNNLYQYSADLTGHFYGRLLPLPYNVHSVLSVAPDYIPGGVDVLDTNHNLWTDQVGEWIQVDGNVLSFAVNGINSYAVLGTDRNLWLESPGWMQHGRTWLDGNVLSFAPAGSGYYSVEGTDHNLWLESPGWMQHGRTWVDGNVASFAQQVSFGSYEVLGLDHNLWLESVGWMQHGRTWVDGNVASFLTAGNGYSYVEGTDGSLWLESPGWMQHGRTRVDGNVLSFASF